MAAYFGAKISDKIDHYVMGLNAFYLITSIEIG